MDNNVQRLKDVPLHLSGSRLAQAFKTKIATKRIPQSITIGAAGANAENRSVFAIIKVCGNTKIGATRSVANLGDEEDDFIGSSSEIVA